MDSSINQIIKNALEEDINGGDITSHAVITDDVFTNAAFIIKEEGIIAGLEVAAKVFSFYDETLNYVKLIEDGQKVFPSSVAAKVSGKAKSILTVERTALNFLQRMSGIATAAHTYSEKIKHTKAQIIDTRKTAPGLRVLDKLAVKIGGCQNHRAGLFDMFLIKDNHIAVAGSLKKAVELCMQYKTSHNLNFLIEVETENLHQVEEAILSGADIIMLDNFSVDDMKKAVEIISGKSKIEASGGINLNNVVEVAETGVDFISIGALTHSVKALDISLELSLIEE
jgi:nicotinate-nucleotide pyrophosphorylase (carboxylating)